MGEANRVLGAKLVRVNARRPAGAHAPNAIELLKADHRSVERLFRQFAQARDSEARATLAEKLCRALLIHMRIEEEIFYPAFLQATGDVEMHQEAQVEHSGARLLIAQIQQSSPDDAHHTAQIKVLATMVQHHVHEEEKRDGMFAEANSAGMDLAALGEQLKVRRDQLKRWSVPKRTRAPRAAFVTR